MKLNIKLYTLSGAGTEIDNFNVTDSYDEYLIKGTATATGNYAISLTGTPQAGEFFRVKYKGLLDITTGSKTFSILGQTLTQLQLNSDLDIECFYDGSAWDVLVKPSFTSAVVASTNLATDSVATTHIQNGAVTEPKLATNSVSTNKIVNLAVTTGKIADLAVTNAKINDVNGSKIVDDTVTNAKLATMTASSIKIGGATGDPADLALGNEEIAIGNGTTIVPMNISNFQYRYVTPAILSLEAGEQCSNYRFTVADSPNIKVIKVEYTVVGTLSGTDPAYVIVSTNFGSNDIANFTIAAGATIDSYGSTPVLYTSPIGGVIEVNATKPTPGGKIILYIHFEKVF
jgi:hypothetical protein